MLSLHPRVAMVTGEQRRSVPLERSCLACIKAKRRCDRQTPQCSRCQQRHKTCQYTNEPLAAPPTAMMTAAASVSARTPASPAMPEFAPISPVSPRTDYSILIAPSEQYSHVLHRMPVSAATPSRRPLQVHPAPAPIEERQRHAMRAHEWKPSLKSVRLAHSPLTTAWLVATLRSYPQRYAATGRTPFVHPLLRDMCRQHSARAADVFDACVLYHQHQHAHHPGLAALRDATARLLASRPDEAGFEVLLSALQALMLAAMTLLFAPGAAGALADDAEAGALLRALSEWTKALYRRVPRHLPASLTAWQAWAYAESVRRSILLAVVLVDTFAAVRSGVFLHSVFSDALPFDSRTYLWEAEMGGPGALLDEAPMISYKELREAWRMGLMRLPSDERSFETLLLVGYWGFEKVLGGQQIDGDIVAASPFPLTSPMSSFSRLSGEISYSIV